MRSHKPKRKPQGKSQKLPEKAVEQSTIRLNRYIANAGVCSRREADTLIAEGKIKVNGKVVTEMGHQVERNDVVSYDGKNLMAEKLVYLLLNKPKDLSPTSLPGWEPRGP